MAFWLVRSTCSLETYHERKFHNVTFLFKVDGYWQTWESWSKCDVSCGTGHVTRRRQCHHPSFGGAECSGPSNERGDCDMGQCPSTLSFNN